MASGQGSDPQKALEKKEEEEDQEEAASKVSEEDAPATSGVEADDTVDMSALRRPVRRTSPANDNRFAVQTQPHEKQREQLFVNRGRRDVAR